MAARSTLRIGVVATRIGGTDGVSLEADAWSRTLQGFGHEIHAFAGRTETPVARYELGCWAEELDLDLLIAENTLSLPVHLPLGMAIGRLAGRSGLPVMAHHHDLPWERSRFTRNAVEDVLDEAFPPRLPNIHHVCINSRQRGELERRVASVGSRASSRT
jgi:hypothetical protein